jgi:iduronate 2-sulfatase
MSAFHLCDQLLRYGWLFLVLPVAVAAEDPGTVADRGATEGAIRRFVLIISDDLKADALGCYGNAICETPHLDRLAAEGMVFTRAYCQGTWCAPSRQSLMYSRYRGKSRRNLGEYFIDHDFYTARVGKIFHMRVPGDIIPGTNGADVASSWTERFNSPGREAHTPGHYACLNLNQFTTELEGRQSTAMPHRMFVTVRYEGDGADQPDAKSAAKAIELLRAHHGEPFLLAVGLIRPHYPMVAPQQYFDRYDYRQIPLPHVPEDDLDDIPPAGLRGIRNGNNPIGQYPDNQRRMWAGYYAAVSFMDAQVGRIVAELERLGIREQTAIVFTSDHGYHLGEHTLWQKKNFHEDVTRVPLIIDAPGYQPGRTQGLAELVDIYPTLAELAGLPLPGDIDGRSLVPLLADPRAMVRRSALSRDRVRGGVEHALRTADWAYMQYVDGSEELYQMNEDPRQFDNMADDPRHADTLQSLRDLLRQRLDAAAGSSR